MVVAMYRAKAITLLLQWDRYFESCGRHWTAKVIVLFM